MAVVGAYHLADNPTLYEPARSNTFRFLVAGLNDLVKVGSDPDSTDYIANAQELLEFSVKSTTVPSFTQEVITIRRGNSVMKAAGLPSFGEGSLVIDDFIGADGRSILMAWQNLSYNVETQNVGLMSSYKKNCYLLEYNADQSAVVRQWILHGCWISSLSQTDFDHDSGDKRTITATIQYDWAQMQLGDDE